MPYEYPEGLSVQASPDDQRMWRCLWKLVEALNVDEQVRAALARKDGTLSADADTAMQNEEQRRRPVIIPDALDDDEEE